MEFGQKWGRINGHHGPGSCCSYQNSWLQLLSGVFPGMSNYCFHCFAFFLRLHSWPVNSCNRIWKHTLNMYYFTLVFTCGWLWRPFVFLWTWKFSFSSFPYPLPCFTLSIRMFNREFVELCGCHLWSGRTKTYDYAGDWVWELCFKCLRIGQNFL